MVVVTSVIVGVTSVMVELLSVMVGVTSVDEPIIFSSAISFLNVASTH